jgi:hypothetical protein
MIRDKVTVGIFKNGNNYQIRLLTAETTEKPLFKRDFAEPILALGYCRVLNKLSKKSIESIIKKQ